MTAAEPFVNTILEQPDGDGPRLVFADWLEEHGDPHAELIRVQCELAQLRADDPRRERLELREHEILTRRDAEWLAPIRDMGLSGRFRRGFLEVTVTGVKTLLQSSERLLAMPWALHVHLRDAAASLADVGSLAASPIMAHLQRLDLSRSKVGNDGARKLAQSPFRCRLTHFMLNHAQLSSSGLTALVERMDFGRLIELRLYGNGIGATGGKALAVTPRLQALRILDLSYNQLGTVGGEYLAESLFLGQLQALHVRGNTIGTRGKKALRRRFGPKVHLGSNDSPF